MNENNSIANYNISINDNKNIILLTFEIDDALIDFPYTPVKTQYDPEKQTLQVFFGDDKPETSLFFPNFPKDKEDVILNHHRIWVVGLSERIPSEDKIVFAKDVILESSKPKKLFKI